MACLLVVLAYPGIAMAGKACVEGDTRPRCQDDETPSLPVTPVDNFAQYGGSISEESNDGSSDIREKFQLDLGEGIYPPPLRFCAVGSLHPTDGTGSYECDKGGLLTFNISDWTVKKRGDARYCELLNTGDIKYRQFTATRYHYHNFNGCAVGDTCEIGIAHWSYRDPATDANGNGGVTGNTHQYFNIPGNLPDIGLISIGVDAQGTPLASDLNPFSAIQQLPISNISITFKLAGKNKTIAECVASLNGEAWLDTKPYDR